jgi:hypothetical protein
MKDSIREITQIPELTMGLDLGDKFSYYCIIDKSGKRVEEGRVKTQRRAMERFFKSQPKMRVVVETGTHSWWVQAIAKEQGHEEIVAKPRQVRLISQNRKKSDRKDGELLGRLGRVDPELLYPIQHRAEAAQADLAVDKARDELVRGPEPGSSIMSEEWDRSQLWALFRPSRMPGGFEEVARSERILGLLPDRTNPDSGIPS